MNPKIDRREAAAVEAEGGLLAVVVRGADGTRSVSELAAYATAETGSEVDEEAIFLSLDNLADAGLLAQRVAPPAGRGRISRRQLFGGLGVATAAAGLAVGLFSRRALAEEKVGSGEEEQKKARAKPAAKEQEHKKPAAKEAQKKKPAARSEESAKKDKAPADEEAKKRTQ